MAKLVDKTKVYGSLSVDKAIITNTGFQNMVLLTTGTAATYTLPACLHVPRAKFKVTIIGGGAGGQTTAATAGTTGSGGGSGAVIVIVLEVVDGVYTFTYTVGAAGASNGAGGLSNIIYNGITYQSGGGAVTGTGGAVTGVTNGTTTNAIGFVGFTGAAASTNASLTNGMAHGGDTPLGYGKGGRHGVISVTGNVGSNATGYGAGGGGGKNGSSATARAGGTGAPGLIILQY